MPLQTITREEVLNYTKNHIKTEISEYEKYFTYVQDSDLRENLAKTFYTARFQSKLMEGLNLQGIELVGFSKNQVILYTSIYEAVVDYVLFELLKDNEKVNKLLVLTDYIPVQCFNKDVKLLKGDESLYVCKTKAVSIKPYQVRFEDRINLFEELGIIDSQLKKDIQTFYNTRNTIHIIKETKLKKIVTLSESKDSYWRLKPFTESIKKYFNIDISDLGNI